MPGVVDLIVPAWARYGSVLALGVALGWPAGEWHGGRGTAAVQKELDQWRINESERRSRDADAARRAIETARRDEKEAVDRDQKLNMAEVDQRIRSAEEAAQQQAAERIDHLAGALADARERLRRANACAGPRRDLVPAVAAATGRDDRADSERVFRSLLAEGAADARAADDIAIRLSACYDRARSDRQMTERD